MQTKLAFLIAGAWIVAIFLLVFFGIRSEFRRRNILKNGIRTKAIVVMDKASVGKDHFSYSPVVSFKLENGKNIEVTRRYSTQIRHYNVGDVEYIYYLKEDPNKFVFAAGKERKENLMILAFFLISVVIFLIVVNFIGTGEIKKN